MNADTRMQRILSRKDSMHYIFARNMTYSPTESNPCPSRLQRGQIENLVCRIAFAIQIGGVLELMEVPLSNKQWWVSLHHKDGSKEGLRPFRRRKRAEV